jgi:hypothetical protein
LPAAPPPLPAKRDATPLYLMIAVATIVLALVFGLVLRR